MHEIQVFFFKKHNNGIWEERAKIYLRSKYVTPLDPAIILPHLVPRFQLPDCNVVMLM